MLNLRRPEIEFRILCLEGNVIWFTLPSSGRHPGPVEPVCAERLPKATFVNLFIFVLFCLALRCFSLPCLVLFNLAFPASTSRWPNTVIMLAHCLRRWPSISSASSQRFMFPGLSCINVIVLTRWLHVVDKPWAGHGWKIRHHWIVCCYHYLQQWTLPNWSEVTYWWKPNIHTFYRQSNCIIGS